MITLAQIQTPAFATASGYCTTSADFMELVNLAVDELIIRGDWPGSIVPIRVCIRNGCATWPRYVAEIRKMNTCRGNAVQLRNQWYEFLDHSHGCGRNEIFGWHAWRGEERQMVAQYRAPTYNDIYGPNCMVRVYPMVQEDLNLSGWWFFGTDNNGQPLMTDNGDGTWSQGVTLTWQPTLGYGTTNTFISRIDRVVKPVTQANNNLFAYDANQNGLFDLAVYEPSEVNPSYLRYQIEDQVPRANCGDCSKSVIALVKLLNLPLSAPTDWVIIDNKRALLLAIRALKLEEALGDATKLWQSAIETLNRSSENNSPDDQFAVANEPFGRGVRRSQQCF